MNGGLGYSQVDPIQGPSKNSTSWQIPRNFESSTARIKVAAYNSSGTELASHTSPNFTIALPVLKPTARPEVNNAGPAVGVSVTFTGGTSIATSGRSIVSYRWDLGDGTIRNGATVFHAYGTAGSYNARLTVTDSAGQTDSRSVTIWVSGSNLGTNNQSAYFADPVNLATGNFILEAEDIEVPGLGFPLNFTRFYNSKESKEDGLPMGYNWTHSYNLSLEETSEGIVTIRFGDGRQEIHTPESGGGYKAESGVHDTLTKTAANRFSLRSRDQITRTFEAGRLASISDRNGNTQILVYDADGRLLKISDPSGRFLEFTYSVEGRLVVVTDSMERTIQYFYTAGGDLRNVIDLRGETTHYTYDEHHQILTATDPNWNVFVSNTYDNQQRVVSLQHDALGNPTTFQYDFVGGVTTVTDPFGRITKHRHDERLRLIAQTNELGFTEGYAYDTNNNRTLVVDRNGNATRYKYDARGNVTEKTEPNGAKTTIEYNGFNDPIRRTDALGNITAFAYDARGNLVRTTDALGRQTNLTVDQTGKVTAITNRNGQRTTHVYDTAGNRTETRDALGGVERMRYDRAGRLISRTDPLGRETRTTYDRGNKVISVMNPLGDSISNDYDANGNLVRITDALGNETRFEYDAKDRLVKAIDPDGGVVSHEYDAYDRKTRTVDAAGNAARFEYDATGRMTATINALGERTEFRYDPKGNRTRTTDPLGRSTEFRHDVVDRLVAVIDPLGNETRLEYDLLGRKIKTLDPLRRETTSHFDPLGRLVRVVDAAGGIVSYTYDAEGNRLTATNPRGQRVTQAYDAVGRLIRRVEPNGRTETFVYDSAGNRIRRTDAAGRSFQYEYDAANRLVRMIYPSGPPVVFSYDANGNRLSMIDPAGISTFDYDRQNRMTRYVNPFGQTVEYGYDANSRRKRILYPGNRPVTYIYDAAGRMKSVADWQNRTTQYRYNAAGELVETINPNGTRTLQSYDAAGRLATLGNQFPDSSFISSYAYTLDPVGNHTSVEVTEPVEPAVTEESVAYTYDVEDRLTSQGGVAHTHDVNGNLVKIGNEVTLTYDFENRLTRFQGAPDQDFSFRYDGVGNRIGVDYYGGTNPFRFVLDVNTPLTNVLGVTDQGGQFFEFYVYGIGLVSKIDASDNAEFYHYDSRGSTIAVTNAAGQQVRAFAYDPFGRLLGRSPVNASDRFTYLGRHGVMFDFNGFHHVRARYYSVKRGRFISKDPFLGFEDQSQTLNRYVYALNNPVRLIDVSGFSARESNASGFRGDGRSSLSESNVVGQKRYQEDGLGALYEAESKAWFEYANKLQILYGGLGIVGGYATGNQLGMASGFAHVAAGTAGLYGQNDLARNYERIANLADLGSAVVGLADLGRSVGMLYPAVRNVGINFSNLRNVDAASGVGELYLNVLDPGIAYGIEIFAHNYY